MATPKIFLRWRGHLLLFLVTSTKDIKCNLLSPRSWQWSKWGRKDRDWTTERERATGKTQRNPRCLGQGRKGSWPQTRYSQWYRQIGHLCHPGWLQGLQWWFDLRSEFGGSIPGHWWGGWRQCFHFAYWPNRICQVRLIFWIFSMETIR